jgi:hypothetical protein
MPFSGPKNFFEDASSQNFVECRRIFGDWRGSKSALIRHLWFRATRDIESKDIVELIITHMSSLRQVFGMCSDAVFSLREKALTNSGR